jgi:hypothetical protein
MEWNLRSWALRVVILFLIVFAFAGSSQSSAAADVSSSVQSSSSSTVSPPPEILQYSHTLLYLVRYEERTSLQASSLSSEESTVLFKLSDGVDVLASHIDLKSTLVRLLVGTWSEAYASDLSPLSRPQGGELVLRLGGIASLAAKVDFLANLMQYLIGNLMASEVPLPAGQDEITLTFNLKGAQAALGIAAQLPALSSSSSDGSDGASELDSQGLFDVDQITVKISNGTITSEAELDPADLTLTRGQIKVHFVIGSNTITSTTIFTKGEGLQKELLVVTAQLGMLNLTGEATFTSGLQEFKIEATLAGLLSFSTLLTSEGFREPTLGLEIRF